MPNYRHCTNLATFTAQHIADQGGDAGALVPCAATGGYFDGVDSRFLVSLGDYRIGDPVPAAPDPQGIIRVKTLEQLQSDGIVGCYTTLEAVMSPAARRLVGWGPEVLGPDYVEPAA
jgi:hypothetical protein